LSESHTTYGVIGVKVWIFKGEVFDKVQLEQAPAEGEAAQGAGAPPAQPPAAEATAQA
jgi:small subunit ribosomal protein S3